MSHATTASLHPASHPGRDDDPDRPRVTRADVDGLYREYAAPLRVAVRARVWGTDDQVDDACAHAWLILLRARPCLDRAFFWLLRVAAHEMWRIVREDRERAPLTALPVGLDEVDGCGSDTDPLAPLHARELLSAVAKTLPERKRNLVALQALGYSYREIGALTGASYTAVNRHLSEARRLLAPLRDPLDG